MNLAGVRMLDLTRLLPGPFATQLLADLGADVVKIESPDTGDYARDLSPYTAEGVGAIFDAVNRGKRSVAIDLSTPDGQAVFRDLLADADVVIEGFRPGVAGRLGVDVETVHEHDSEIVYCSVSGFGQTGPLADSAGHDLTYAGYAGLLDMTRAGPDASPEIPGYPIADMAGGLFAAFAVVGALLSRELHGGGEYIDVSLTEVLTAFGQPLAYEALEGDPPTAGETELTGGLPWYAVYETADGEYLTLAALEPKFWKTFCETVDREDLESVHGTRDDAELAALRTELESIFAEQSREEWLGVFGSEDAMVGPVLSLEETLSHPHFAERGLVREPEGTDAPRIGFPALVGGDRPAATGSAPEQGGDTEAVLREAGIEGDRIRTLVEEGVLGIGESGE